MSTTANHCYKTYTQNTAADGAAVTSTAASCMRLATVTVIANNTLACLGMPGTAVNR